jgi:hypothetical protein
VTRAHLQLWAAAGALAPWLFPQPSAAEPVQLEWHASAGCPERPALDLDARAPVEVEVWLLQLGPDRARARLRFSGALDAERELEGESCAAVADAAGWLISDVLAHIPALPQPLAAEPSPPTPAEQLGASAWAWLDTAALPQPSPGFGLELALRLAAHWRFSARPRIWIPQARSLSQTSVSAGLAELPLQACYGFSAATLWFGPCASLDLGLVWAGASGALPAPTRFGPWLAAEAALAGEWSISPRWSLGAELAGVHPLWFPRISLVAAGPVDQAARWYVRAGFSLGMRF